MRKEPPLEARKEGSSGNRMTMITSVTPQEGRCIPSTSVWRGIPYTRNPSVSGGESRILRFVLLSIIVINIIFSSPQFNPPGTYSVLCTVLPVLPSHLRGYLHSMPYLALRRPYLH